MIDNEYGAVSQVRIGRGNEYPVPLLDQTWATSVGSQRLIASAMVQPMLVTTSLAKCAHYLRLMGLIQSQIRILHTLQ